MKRRRKNFSTEDCSAINNALQPYRGQLLTYKQLKSVLTPAVNNTQEVINRFSRFSSPIFRKESKGMYRIPTEPIYSAKMQNAWAYKPEDQKRTQTEIEKAIQLLKSNGFKILQQDFDLDEALKNPKASVSSFIKWNEL